MEVPRGPQRFVAPEQQPTSPPATPGTRSRNTSDISHTSNSRKRQGFIHLGFSPPENIEPLGFDNAFSYTPPDRDNEGSTVSSSSSSSSDADDDAKSDENDPVPEIETRSDVSKRRASESRRLGGEAEFEAEEISDDDIAYDDESLHVQPDETEEAESEEDAPEPALEQEDILESLKNLKCGGPQEREKAQEFEEAQRERYKKKKNRWSIGGTKKRSHTQSIGSISDNEDVDPLDDVETGSRRLRRCTYGREDAERPNRSSLLFEIPPAEIEEIGYAETIHEDKIPELEPVIVSSSDPDSDEDWISSDADDEDEDEDKGDMNADEDMLVPTWLMEIDSNPPSPEAVVE